MHFGSDNSKSLIFVWGAIIPELYCMPRTTAILLTCLLGLALFPLGCQEVPARRFATPFPVLRYGSAEERYAKEIAAMLARDSVQPPPQEGIALLGSSSFTRWDSMLKDLAPLPVFNRGFGGSGLRQAAYYAPQIVTPYRPRLVVVYCGENDLISASVPAQQALDDFQALVKVLRQQQPDLRIVFLSMKPSPKRWSFWPKFQEANALVKQYTEEERGLRYFDVGSAMLDSTGRPFRQIWMPDSLHMNTEGYAIWRGLLLPMLEAEYAQTQPGPASKN